MRQAGVDQRIGPDLDRSVDQNIEPTVIGNELVEPRDRIFVFQIQPAMPIGSSSTRAPASSNNCAVALDRALADDRRDRAVDAE